MCGRGGLLCHLCGSGIAIPSLGASHLLCHVPDHCVWFRDENDLGQGHQINIGNFVGVIGKPKLFPGVTTYKMMCPKLSEVPHGDGLSDMKLTERKASLRNRQGDISSS